MGRKVDVPSTSGLNIEGIPYGMVVFLQGVRDAINTMDANVVYRDDITVNVTNAKQRALTAQGQAFSVSGTNVASGEDYVNLVGNVRIMLEDLNALREEVKQLKSQIKGS